MNVLRAAALGAIVLAFGAGAASAGSGVAPLLVRATDPCCVVTSIGPGGRAVMVENVVTRHRWLYSVTGTALSSADLEGGARVDFDPLTGQLYGNNQRMIAGALVSAAN
jgi:hypothetical protein